jgi:linoleoyl-CoA desaturase
MVVKTLVLLAALFVPLGLILAGGLPGPLALALCLVMGLAMAGIGFGIAHDANHGAYSANPRVNAGLGLVFDLLGANGYMWRITHNVIHHTYTNIHGVDEDLEVSPLLRLSPHSPHRWFHRFQHLYAPFAYSMSTLNWVYWKDFDYFRRRRLGPYQDRRHPRGHVALLVGAKLLYYGWSVVLPLLVLDFSWWQILIGYLIVHLSGGLVLGVVFQLAHVVEQASQPLPDDLGRMPNGWLVHEMVTTANFSTRNRLLTWYVGGLNHQVEHHLFPRTCSVHYPRISGIVREVASKHGVPYHSNPTLWSAIRSHWRMLRQLGRPMEALPSAA